MRILRVAKRDAVPECTLDFHVHVQARHIDTRNTHGLKFCPRDQATYVCEVGSKLNMLSSICGRLSLLFDLVVTFRLSRRFNSTEDSFAYPLDLSLLPSP